MKNTPDARHLGSPSSSPAYAKVRQFWLHRLPAEFGFRRLLAMRRGHGVAAAAEAECERPSTHAMAPDDPEKALAELLDMRGRTDSAGLDRQIDIIRFLLPVRPRDRVPLLTMLGTALLSRAAQSSDQRLLEEGITRSREALQLAALDSSHPAERLNNLNNLGAGLLLQYKRHRSKADLDEAIDRSRLALSVAAEGDLNRSIYLGNLGNALLHRYDHVGSEGDLDAAIVSLNEALGVSHANNPQRAEMLNHLGNALLARSARSESQPDVDAAIGHFHEALASIAADSLNRAEYLDNLGSALRTRYHRTGNEDDLDAAIACLRGALASTAESSPDRATRVGNLGDTLLFRHEQTGNATDLDEAIVCARGALALTTTDKGDRAARLASVGNGLLRRYDRDGDPIDLYPAVTHLREALASTPADHPDHAVALSNLAGGLLRRYERTNEPADLDESIALLRDALGMTPVDSASRPELLPNLGIALQTRYERAGSDDDLDGAIDALVRALERLSVECTPVPYLSVRRFLGRARMCQRDWLGAAAELEPLLATGTALVMAEPTRQRRQLLLSRLAGVGDDLATARLHLKQPETFISAVDALGQGRAIMLDLGLRLDAPGRAGWGTQIAADQEEERCDNAAAGVLRDRFRHFREVVEKAGVNACEPFDHEKLTKAIPCGGALVMPVIPSYGESFVMVQTAEQQVPEVLPLRGCTRDWLNARVREWSQGYDAFLRALSDGNARATERHAATAKWNAIIVAMQKELGKTLMAPLDVLLRKLGLRSGAEIVLMPTGRLGVLPLHAAWINQPASDTIFLDNWIVSQVPSLSAFVASRSRAAAQETATPSLLAITNPTSDPRIAIERNPAWDAFEGRPRLPFDGLDATVKAISGAMPECTHISFYGHTCGFPPALLMANEEPFAAAALRELDLSASRLLLLWGCGTGLGEPRVPDEFVGFPGAALEAGLPGVVTSLWVVDAGASALLAKCFLMEHFGSTRSPAAALREAVLAMRRGEYAESKGGSAGSTESSPTSLFGEPSRDAVPAQPASRPDYTQPFYWAAWVITGA